MSISQILLFLVAILFIVVTSGKNCDQHEAYSLNNTCIDYKLCNNTEICSHIVYPMCGKFFLMCL